MAALVDSPSSAADESGDEAYVREIRSWRAKRVAKLTAPDGWLSVTGLYWLEPGCNGLVRNDEGRLQVSTANASAGLGAIVVTERGARFLRGLESDVRHGERAAADLTLRADDEGEPTVLTRGTESFYLIRRGGRLALRVKDSESPARRAFRGIETFPIDARWRRDASFEPYSPPRSIRVPNVLGGLDTEICPGAIVFEVADQTLRLEPVLEKGESEMFVIFADRTNTVETYATGRFLYAPPPAGGRTVIDFNKAYNPPCVFTPFVTCPLPPPQNRLPVRIEAGEKKPAAS